MACQPRTRPTINDTLVTYLSTRRTVPSVNLREPGPDEACLSDILTIAARVPDHGKLAPWRFVVFTKDHGSVIGKRLADLWLAENPDASEDRLEQERTRFLRAPVVIGVVSVVVREHKIPVWEQELSAGAVCLNCIHGCHAHGFSAQWLTEWYTYHDAASQFLGARAGERFAGFIHVGTPGVAPVERARPDVSERTIHWRHA